MAKLRSGGGKILLDKGSLSSAGELNVRVGGNDTTMGHVDYVEIGSMFVFAGILLFFLKKFPTFVMFCNVVTYNRTI